MTSGQARQELEAGMSCGFGSRFYAGMVLFVHRHPIIDASGMDMPKQLQANLQAK